MDRSSPDVKIRARGVCIALLSALLCVFVSVSSAGDKNLSLIQASKPSDQAVQKRFIHLEGRTIDPDTAEAEIFIEGVKQPYLVALKEKVSPANRKDIEAVGGQIVGYVPDDSLMVRTDRPSLLAAVPSVKWMGSYQPTDKVAPDLTRKIAGAGRGTTVAVNINLFEGADEVNRVLKEMKAGILEEGGNIIRAEVNAADVETLARNPLVAWLEPVPVYTVENDRARGVTAVSSVWTTPGLTGLGQTIAISDSGLDTGVDKSTKNGDIHADFDNRVTFFNWYGTSPNDKNGHGTHVTGTAAGSGAASGGQFAGVAKQANIVFQGLGDNAGSNYVYPPADLTTLFQQARDAGAFIHTNSWGSTSTLYNSDARYVDQFMWEHKDALILFSAGNSGPTAGSVGAPGNAKNCISVGASGNNRPEFGTNPPNTYNPTPDQMAFFSSRGPTGDGRIKPDVVAPGCYILSAKSSLVGTNPLGWGAYNSYYSYGGGTSMATPHVAGIAVLVRQYFTSVEGIVPSGSLIKATLMNGAIDMPASGGTGAVPNFEEGFGRSNAAEAITPATPRHLSYVDETAGISTDAVRSYVIRVNSAANLKLTLAWTDYMSIYGAAKHLVNDLDMTLMAPDGTRYNGNDMTAPYDSTTDTTNNVEMILLSAPAAGLYLLTVTGSNVPQGPQPFSVAMSGDAVVALIAGSDGSAADFAAGTASDRLRIDTGPGGDAQLATVAVPGASLLVYAVSSTEPDPSSLADHTVDGDASTLWASAGSSPAATETIAFDLGAAVLVNRIDLFSGTWNFSDQTGNGAPTFTPIDFDIETSTDGTTWTLSRSVTNFYATLAAWSTFQIPPVSARYLQIKCKRTTFWSSDNNYYYTLGEVRAGYSPNGTVTAYSSVDAPAGGSTFTPDLAVDANARSMWTSGGAATASTPEYITMDLGFERTISHLRMHSGIYDFIGYTPGGSATFCPETFQVLVSSDGSTWTTAGTVSGFNPLPGVWTDWTFTPVRGRYVRLYVTTLKLYDENGNGVADPAEKYYVTVPEIDFSNGLPSVTSSSSEEQVYYSGTMAADGNPSTCWISMGWSAGQQEVTIDLKDAQPTSGVRIYSGDDLSTQGLAVGYDTFVPIDFHVDTSTDGLSWTTRTTVTGNSQPMHTWRQFNFAAVPARYVRLVVTKAPIYDPNSNHVADPWELQYVVIGEIEAVTNDHQETFVSRVIDAGSTVPLRSINWQMTAPAGSSVLVQIRSGNTADLSGRPWTPADGSEFSDPSAVNDPAASARYFQYRLRLRRLDPAATTVAVSRVWVSTD